MIAEFGFTFADSNNILGNYCKKYYKMYCNSFRSQ